MIERVVIVTQDHWDKALVETSEKDLSLYNSCCALAIALRGPDRGRCAVYHYGVTDKNGKRWSLDKAGSTIVRAFDERNYAEHLKTKKCPPFPATVVLTSVFDDEDCVRY